jgi:hypothetical protein
MFWEMNNGRILTFYDLGRFGARPAHRPDPHAAGAGWGLVVAGSSVRYRARIRPFQRFELRTRLRGGTSGSSTSSRRCGGATRACNHALMRTGVTEKGRLVETRRVAEAMGLSPDSPPLPDWAASWTDADAAALAAGGLKPAISSRMQR